MRLVAVGLVIASGVLVIRSALSSERVDPNAWRTVPANCIAEYDARARIIASYCDAR